MLTTGSKELDAFALPDLRERCFPRVLPAMDSLRHCMELGFSPKNLICMQGPFSKRLNEAMIEQLDIAIVVTKDTGRYGGFQEKAEAACAAQALLLERDALSGPGPGSAQFYVSERPADFQRLAEIFLQDPCRAEARQVDIARY